MSLQYRSAIKDCQEQLEHLAETGAAAQSSHYLAQVYRFTFIVASFYKSIAVGVDVQAIVDLAPCVEILFMDSNPGGLVMPHLLNWVSLHFPACEERARYVSSVRNMYL